MESATAERGGLSGAEQDHAEAEEERAEAARIAAEKVAAAGGEPDPDPQPDPEAPQLEAGAEPVLQTGDDQLSFAVGGKRPQESSLAFTGGKIGVEGQFAKGADVSVLLKGRVHDVGFKDTLDRSTKQAVASARRQKAQIIECTLATPEALARALVDAAGDEALELVKQELA